MSELSDELKRLKADNAALKSEMNLDPTSSEFVQQRLDSMVLTAIGTLEGLMQHSESDGTRAKIAMFVVQRKLLQLETSPDEDFKKFLESLKAA